MYATASAALISIKTETEIPDMATTTEYLTTAETLVVPTAYVTLDGLNSGVPTRTTPTLTPTTLRNIEQTLIDLQDTTVHQSAAGFVPPVVVPQSVQQTSNNAGAGMYLNVDSKSWQGGTATVATSSASSTRPTVVTMAEASASCGVSAPPPQPTATTRRNVGGRRPRNDGVSPEEEQRRMIRRERNKLAAARCRKRRMDHTNLLVEETDELEAKKQELHNEIQQLTLVKEELEFLLDAHRPCCRLRGNCESPRMEKSVSRILVSPVVHLVKQEPDDEGELVIHEPSPNNPVLLTNDDDVFGPPAAKKPHMMAMKPSRPTSLPVVSATAQAYAPTTSLKVNTVTVSEVAGIPITTPSAGIPFNFESLMEGGTGLTPVSSGLTPMVPSCSSQQRSSNSDLSSPDSVPPKLVSL